MTMVKKQSIMHRRTFFEFRDEARAFSEKFSTMVRDLTRDESPIPESNELRLTHGRSWDHPGEHGAGELQTMSAEISISFDDLMQGRLAALPEAIEHVATQMKRHFYQMMYQKASEGAEKVGNVASAEDAGSFATGFLEMFRKLEFGVGRNGQVNLPEIHAGPGMAKKILTELEAQPAEYHAEIERLKAEKTASALIREKMRKARFVRPAE